MVKFNVKSSSSLTLLQNIVFIIQLMQFLIQFCVFLSRFQNSKIFPPPDRGRSRPIGRRKWRTSTSSSFSFMAVLVEFSVYVVRQTNAHGGVRSRSIETSEHLQFWKLRIEPTIGQYFSCKQMTSLAQSLEQW